MALKGPDLAAAYGGDPFAALALDPMDSFTPFSIDVSPLQKFLLTLARQVEQLQADNAALREELAGLKIPKRLETLEAGLQELAEHSQPGNDYGAAIGAVPAPVSAYPLSTEAVAASISGAAAAASASPADSNWVMVEFNSIKERLQAQERRAEALWHVKEGGEELKGVVDRLKADVESVQGVIADTQGAARHAQHLAEKVEAGGVSTRELIAEIHERLVKLDSEDKKAAEERRDSNVKMEGHVNGIWDQIRHVENSLSQRLTLAETSQVSTLQEVDEMKEAANEVVARLDDTKRHVAALESKLESFNTQVAAAISPLHSSLAAVQQRLEELSETKQDREKALTLDDVNAGVSRAIDHADRRADNLTKSIAALEERVEALNDSKANLADVVLTVDLEALLAAHSSQLDGHLAAQKEEIMRVVSLKADREEVVALEGRQSTRMASLEGAILKGLRAISDKVSAALAQKLDLDKFSEFKVQVRAILADVEDRLKDWSPAARGMKAPLDGSGAVGATSCLCCDSRVRSVRDLQSMGFGAADKVLSPERLPITEPLLPSIHRSPEMSSSVNAKLAKRRADTTALLRSSGGQPVVVESLPPVPPEGASQATFLATVDPAALLGAKGEVRGRAPSLNNHQAPVPGTSTTLGNPPVVPVVTPLPGMVATTSGPTFTTTGALVGRGPGSGEGMSQGSKGGSGGGGGSGSMKVEVETVRADTISGAIHQGRIPSTRGAGRAPGKLNGRPVSEGVAPWSSHSQAQPPTVPSLDFTIDLTQNGGSSSKSSPAGGGSAGGGGGGSSGGQPGSGAGSGYEGGQSAGHPGAGATG